MAKLNHRSEEAARSLSAEGLYRRDSYRFKLLGRDEQSALILLRNDVEQRNRFVEHNLRLVIKIARYYWFGCQKWTTGIELLDLIQEGNIGLLRAIEKFKPELGFQFSTYACHWIRQHIGNFLSEKGHLIRFPSHEIETILRYRKCWQELEKSQGYRPSFADMAKKMGFPLKKIIRLDTDLKIMDTASLDAILQEHDREEQEGAFLPNSICDRSTPSPFDLLAVQDAVNQHAAEDAQKMQRLQAAGISERDITIYRLRVPYDPLEKPKKLEEIGRRFGITRERVRQIVNTAKKIADGAIN